MSHPVPGHDYTEKASDESKRSYRKRKNRGETVGSQMWHIKKATAKLKQMVDEPAEKAWFIKHGLPKGITATTDKRQPSTVSMERWARNKAATGSGAKAKALSKKSGPVYGRSQKGQTSKGPIYGRRLGEYLN